MTCYMEKSHEREEGGRIGPFRLSFRRRVETMTEAPELTTHMEPTDAKLFNFMAQAIAPTIIFSASPKRLALALRYASQMRRLTDFTFCLTSFDLPT